MKKEGFYKNQNTSLKSQEFFIFADIKLLIFSNKVI